MMFLGLLLTSLSLFTPLAYGSTFPTLLESLMDTDIASNAALLSYESYEKSRESREKFLAPLRVFDDSMASKMCSGDFFIRNQKIQAAKIVAHFDDESPRNFLVNSESVRIGIFKIDEHKKQIYISFTGTCMPYDWLKNFGWNKKKFEFFGKTIETADGFYSACSERLPILFESLDQEIARLGINVKEYEFILSGHSLGGAIAGLATYKIYEKYDLHLKDGIFNSNNQVKLITFGCPQFLYKENDFFIGKDNALRIRHDMDSVPNASKNLPLIGVKTYVHVGHKLELALPLWYDNTLCKLVSSVCVTYNHNIKQYLTNIHSTIHHIVPINLKPTERRRESVAEVYDIVCLKIEDLLSAKTINDFSVTWAPTPCERGVICSLHLHGHSQTIPLIEFGSSSADSVFFESASENFCSTSAAIVSEFPSLQKTSLSKRRVEGEDELLTNFVPIRTSKVHEMLHDNHPLYFKALFLADPATSLSTTNGDYADDRKSCDFGVENDDDDLDCLYNPFSSKQSAEICMEAKGISKSSLTLEEAVYTTSSSETVIPTVKADDKSIIVDDGDGDNDDSQESKVPSPSTLKKKKKSNK